MSLGDEPGYPETGHTRTRLPDDPYGGARRGGRSSSRSLVTVVGVVVLLIAAIAFANRGGNDGSSDSTDTGSNGNAGQPVTSSTAASGTKPVETKSDGIPTGYAHSQQGAQSAAANYSTALGSDGMFITATRHSIVQTVADPSVMNSMQSGFDTDYSTDFLKKAGLNADGTAPQGSTFVSRTLPAGAKVTSYSTGSATVEVWCNGLFGMSGEKSTNPVTSNWFTVTMKLNWSDGDWKVLGSSQRTGPTPVTGDNPVSGTDEITKAVQEFGGFTYAR